LAFDSHLVVVEHKDDPVSGQASMPAAQFRLALKHYLRLIARIMSAITAGLFSVTAAKLHSA
jgi:hypothetical protein